MTLNRPRLRTRAGANGHPAAVPLLLKDRAYAELRRRILSGVYPPESFLAERQLSDDLGMSKTPVKAALERLEHEGLISVAPQQGIVVRSLTIAEIVDQYEIRIALESYCLRTMAGKLAVDQSARLRANLGAQKRMQKQFDVELAVKLDSEFHSLFPTFLGNQEILRAMSQLGDKMANVIRTVFQSHPDRVGSSYTEHVAIAEAVIAGDGSMAARLITEHLEYGKSLLLMRRPR